MVLENLIKQAVTKWLKRNRIWTEGDVIKVILIVGKLLWYYLCLLHHPSLLLLLLCIIVIYYCFTLNFVIILF